MYEAKSRGKDKYEVYNPGMGVRVEQRMSLGKDLRKAIERGEFEVYYQPKVLLETGKIVGAEALVRWQHPDRGLLPPAQFVPLAEETGLIDQMGLWVLKESCHQLKEWQEQGLAKQGAPLGLCVNLSASEIQQPDLADKIVGVLQETGLDPGCLMLEISEKTTMKDTEYALDKLRELKDLGVELTLDDFGTGYCSLMYLEHSVFDALKIDRQLIHRDRGDSEECAMVISAMANMAHSLGLTVIVEGVETEEQLVEGPSRERRCEVSTGCRSGRRKDLARVCLVRLLFEVDLG